MTMRIRQIDTIELRIPFRSDLAPHLIRSGLLSFRNQVTLYRVHLEDGTVGWGDAMGQATPVDPFVGQDAVVGLQQIRHGGVQMALFDAVGRCVGEPAHRLMGRQVRDRVPLGYWTAEVPPDVLAAHVTEAASAGYRVYKTKCRPWWDPVAQVEAAAAVAPPGFRLWLDFNGHLRDSRQALRVLERLQRFECIAGFESPIPQRDADGYRALRQRIDRPIAAHYGSGCCHVHSIPRWDPGVPATRQISDNLCDAFVLGGHDVATVQQHAAVADEAHRPFWIQVIGTGLRAAWLAHLASTLPQAVLSNLAAHTIWSQDVTELPAVTAGTLRVPEGPGLGVDVDEDLVERLRAASADVPEVPRHVTSVVYADGSRWHFASDTQRHEAFYFGHAPGFEPGIHLETRADDGSADFDELYQRCATAPLVEGATG